MTDTLFEIPETPSPRLLWMREQGLAGLTDLMAGHITKPYTEEEILTILDDGEYSAELMLQHVLLLWKRTAAERDELMESMSALLEHKPRPDWGGLTIAERLAWDNAKDAISAVKEGKP
jgi:hypothetical protein